VRLHLVVPAGFDDPGRPTGGNLYDRRVGTSLASAGWDVRFDPVPGPWPYRDEAACGALARKIAVVPDGGVVLVDGLIASGAAEVLVPQTHRLRLIILVHTLLAGSGLANEPDDIAASEAAVLAAADAVVTTSAWTRERLLTHYPAIAERVRIVRPGVELAPVAPGTTQGGALLCVANLVPHKGQDLLVDALARLTDLDWRCVCVGALDHDPDFVDRVREQAAVADLSRRLTFAGALDGAALDAEYAKADVLVVPSRSESFGMVVTEALARGLPVLATAVGGLPEALGRDPDDRRPGRLVPPDDPAELAAVLRKWLQDPTERATLRAAALHRRTTLSDWDDAARDLDAVLRPLTIG
jgi:glycosyltransferase involved in cell wall biosynthesis